MKGGKRFMVAFLDNGNNVIETKTMSEGSVGQAVVYPRVVLKYAIVCDCSAIIWPIIIPELPRIFLERTKH